MRERLRERLREKLREKLRERLRKRFYERFYGEVLRETTRNVARDVPPLSSWRFANGARSSSTSSSRLGKLSLIGSWGPGMLIYNRERIVWR